MWKKILPMSLVLVVVSSFIACGEVGLPSAQEIIDGVIESFDNIRTYQFDMDMTQDQTGEAEGEAFEQTVTMDNSGTLDLENVQMRAELTVTVNMVAPEEDEDEMGEERRGEERRGEERRGEERRGILLMASSTLSALFPRLRLLHPLV